MARGSRATPSNGTSRFCDTDTNSAASRSSSRSPTNTEPGTFAAARSETSGPIPHGQPTEMTSKSAVPRVGKVDIAGSEYQTSLSHAKAPGRDRENSGKASFPELAAIETA